MISVFYVALGIFSCILILASIVGGFAAANNDYFNPGVYRDNLGAIWVELFLMRSVLLGYVGSKGIRLVIRAANSGR